MLDHVVNDLDLTGGFITGIVDYMKFPTNLSNHNIERHRKEAEKSWRNPFEGGGEKIVIEKLIFQENGDKINKSSSEPKASRIRAVEDNGAILVSKEQIICLFSTDV